EISRWRAVTGDPVVVVADGYPTTVVPEGELDGVEVRYAHSNARDAADREIVQLVAGDPEPETLVIVTSDRNLRERATGLGAGTEGAGRFLTRIAEIEPPRSDHTVLAHFGVDESALLGRGGEASVFALDRERVLRLPHPDVEPADLDERRRLLSAIAALVPVPVPEVLEHRQVAGRTVVIERRLPGRNAMHALAEPGTDRPTLVRDHLDVARDIAAVPCPSGRFGELWGGSAITAPSFGAWSSARLAASLRAAGGDVARLDPAALTRDLLDVLPEPEPERPRLVHLDTWLGNMLADHNRITAVLDFGPSTIGGPHDLDALTALAYLAPEITPTATAADRAIGRAWARDAGLEGAIAPAERWAAAYWTAATDDHQLRRWCARILLG
ncbi:MAG: phosphotransferase, partial [Acidimicrobiia bacterium]